MIVTSRSKPAASLVGLAWDGSKLWAGDHESRAVLELDENGGVKNTYAAPGLPYGFAFAGARLGVVIGHPETDNRTIRFFDISSRTWLDDSIRCPDDTGSHLAWDGGHLWLSQRYNKVLLQLHPDGTVKHSIDVPQEITGFYWIGATVWLNLRVEKGVSEIAKRSPGATRPAPVERIEGSLVSLTYDGQGLWTVDLRRDALYRIEI
jgi:hypothetical protein